MQFDLFEAESTDFYYPQVPLRFTSGYASLDVFDALLNNKAVTRNRKKSLKLYQTLHKRRSFTLRKTIFYTPKGHLLHGERAPFATPQVITAQVIESQRLAQMKKYTRIRHKLMHYKYENLSLK